MTRPSVPHGRHLLIKLLDFERTPGRYPVALREPRPLFEQVHSVMQIAAGRAVEGLRVAPANEPELRRAARFFVRTVMLRPGADPLTLLGLSPVYEQAQLREHYRLMIRLTHPDFADPGERWPADAATRVNLAKDMLSGSVAHSHPADRATTLSPQQFQRAGDAAVPLKRPRPLLPRPPGVGGADAAASAHASAQDKTPRRARAWLKALLGACAVFFMTGVLWLAVAS